MDHNGLYITKQNKRARDCTKHQFTAFTQSQPFKLGLTFAIQHETVKHHT